MEKDITNDIYEIFNEKMTDQEKQAFLLGRISILLEIGNTFNSVIGNTIDESDKMLKDIQKRLMETEKMFKINQRKIDEEEDDLK